jgi:uncharacterized membrane protein YhaH (DUF805 family)
VNDGLRHFRALEGTWPQRFLPTNTERINAIVIVIITIVIILFTTIIAITIGVRCGIDG